MKSRNDYTIDTVRDRLAQTLDGLLDKKNPLEIDRARAVGDIAQVLINSVKVEVDHMRVTGTSGSGFIPDRRPDVPGLPNGTHSPARGVLVHKMDDRK
ncbi:hypothetical protein C8R31_101629 [Nitrosospira sp. Nsp2]|uniref:hypothetical protein n=1 Tax=Nitrosospira sp. Nsp2 TaxID=136548 RepID=UPI000D4EA139|nr:hypothetical protein [Nitrosospira sp. Nsp2]PTR17465.1 hypothetical protein C8R31_101629 [Nitrosospira sp. Nsp2]